MRPCGASGPSNAYPRRVRGPEASLPRAGLAAGAGLPCGVPLVSVWRGSGTARAADVRGFARAAGAEGRAVQRLVG